jgi:hypothetical protein
MPDRRVSGPPPLRGIGPREGLRPGLVWPSAPDATGATGPTPGRARGPRYRKTSYGMYVPVGVEPSGDQRIVEAAATFRAGVVSGWAGLKWLSARWFDEDGPVPLVLQANEGASAHPDLVRVSQEFLHPDEVVRVDGLRITTPVRSVAFEMRYASGPVRAAQAFAMAAYDDFVSLDELTRYCAEHLPRCTGVGQVRLVLPRLTENAWSPMEVSMGWIWQDAFPTSHLSYNRPVFDLDGRHLATVDVLDVEAGVAGEYYGSLHLAGQQRAQDVVREEKVRAAGLEIAIMMGSDVAEPAGFEKRLDAAYGRAAGRERRWTAVPPAWWVDTSTVAARRRLTAEQRASLLRYRDAA